MALTQEENKRLITVELRGEELNRLFLQAEGKVDNRLMRIEKNVQSILDASNMGKGAWLLLLKVGGVLSTLIITGIWVYERIRSG